jgi:hypothetical protein
VGQEVTRSDGRPYKTSLFKFFVAEPRLVRADETRVAAQLASPEGPPLPYGLYLADAEQENELHVLAPPGAYIALELGLGVPASCNRGDPTVRVYPLSADSDMYWSWGAQYMFQRIEGSIQMNGTWTAFLAHFGFDPSYRVVRMSGAIELPAMENIGILSFDLDAYITPPSGVTEQTVNHLVPPEWMVENLMTRALRLELPGSSP